MSSKRRRLKRKNSRSNHLQFTSLEDRKLLAGISFDATTGIATVDGSNTADQVQLTEVNSKVSVIFHGREVKEFDRSELNRVIFFGRNGDDWFRNASTVPATAYGQLGDDVLLGGDNSDRLLGGAGDDSISGGRGDDFLVGNEGRDSIRGDDGDDQVLGGDDADTIFGGNGHDTLFGEGGDDSLFGLDDDDFLSGGPGEDIIMGGSGRDNLRGDNGNDRMWGGDDNDFMRGSDGNDRMVGGLGDDSLLGEAGSDHMQGNEGLDRLFGSTGDDSLFGGPDDDILIGNEGDDIVIGDDGNDFMLGNDDFDYLDGGNGHDRMHSGNGNDVLRGGNGRDRMYGQDGDDSLDGGEGNDDLSGGRGSDHLKGSQGNDDYSSDPFDDVVDDLDDFSSNDDFELRGTVSNLDTSTKTFEVLGLTVDYSVAYVEGHFENGSSVKVEGAYDGTQILAKEVERENDDHDQKNIEARGVITNLDPTAKTFELLGFAVDYSAARVEGTLADNATIKLEGRYDGNGNISAHRVETTSSNNDSDSGDSSDSQLNGDMELRGVISNLDTTSSTFDLLGIQVNYSAAEIVGTLADGAYFKVEGNYNGVLNARELQLEHADEDQDENFQARGIVSNLDSQSQTFSLLGFTVDFSGSEIDDAFGDGSSIQVEGWLENLSVRAEKIKR